MLKKFILMFVLAFSTILLLAACGTADKEDKKNADVTEDTDNKSKDLLAEIQEKGELVIGTEGVYPPFTFHDDAGELTGFDVDIATEVAELPS